mmetsp:Transcript_109742/g.321256  ORF Transcript_109742/g.321256 Transcript_109742/m.321256 type:complete len:224 (-) Transcript_109742:105-776(-)
MVFLPDTLLGKAHGAGEDSPAPALTPPPLPVVDSAIGPVVAASTVLLVFGILALIHHQPAARVPLHSAVPVQEAVLVLAFVDALGAAAEPVPGVPPIPVPRVLAPLAREVLRSRGLGALAVAPAVQQLPPVDGPVLAVQLARLASEVRDRRQSAFGARLAGAGLGHRVPDLREVAGKDLALDAARGGRGVPPAPEHVPIIYGPCTVAGCARDGRTGAIVGVGA